MLAGSVASACWLACLLLSTAGALLSPLPATAVTAGQSSTLSFSQRQRERRAARKTGSSLSIEKENAWFGLSDECVRSVRLADGVTPEWRETLTSLKARIAAGEPAPAHCEFEGLRAGGSRMWLEARFAFAEENGRITGIQLALRAAKLTADLLAFSRGQPAKPKSLNLSQAVNDALRLCRRLLGEDLEIITWTVATSILPDDEELAVKLADATAGPYVRLDVSDTGTGMTEEVKLPSLRTLLHHQGARPRHRPLPFDRLRNRPAERRLDDRRERTWPGQPFLHLPPAGRAV